MNLKTRYYRFRARLRKAPRDLLKRCAALAQRVRRRFNRDLQWTAWQADFHRIYNETVYAFSNRLVFREIIAMYENNAHLRTDGLFFWDWLSGIYGHYIVLAVGRELDRHTGSVNLIQLMNRMIKRPKVVSRARFMKHFENSEPYIRQLNEQWFTDNFGAGAYADPKFIKKDRNQLQKQCKAVIKYRHMVVAHRSSINLPLTIKQVHNAMDAVEEILKKYHVLFTGSGLIGAEPAIQFNWKRIFRMPWIQ